MTRRQTRGAAATTARRHLIETLLAEREHSHETYRELEARSGIPAMTLASWQRKLRRERSNAVELVEILGTDIGLPTPSAMLEVTLRDGVVIRIPPGFDLEMVGAVLQVLVDPC